MTTLAVNFSIDVTKLNEERFYTGKNGAKYANLTCWITPDEPNQYGQHGGIKEQTTKEERDAGKHKELPYVGNVTAFQGDGIHVVTNTSSQKAAPKQQTPAPTPAPTQNAFPDDDIPF